MVVPNTTLYKDCVLFFILSETVNLIELIMYMSNHWMSFGNPQNKVFNEVYVNRNK